MRPGDLHARFEEAFNSSDLDSLVSLYEPDAFLATEQPARGHAEIREAYRVFLTMKPHIRLETLKVLTGPSGLAMLHGRWSMRATGPDGSEVTLNGRNTEVARLGPDGNWRFVIDNPFSPE